MVGVWEDDSLTSRFGGEAWQEQYFRGLKDLTSKPVVGVGRLTSPDTMVRLIREGVFDLIGAARPSIADPFLPRKIEEGRLQDIRECIGCNICVTGDWTMTPIRCTQNPSMGEEWRRGWHPERIRAKGSDANVLVVGAGPAGLEAAQALGKRGYPVMLAEASRELGGRVVREARLPGLAEWIRVVDYRKGQLAQLPNVELAFESEVTADEVLAYGFAHVAVATGAHWRADGVGRRHPQPLELAGVEVLTPDDLLAGARPQGDRVVVYDDDEYYMGGVLAELLAREGRQVTVVTEAAYVSAWSVNTMDQPRIQRRLLELGVGIELSHAVVGATAGEVHIECAYTERANGARLRCARARHLTPAERRPGRGAARAPRRSGRRPVSHRCASSATRTRRARSRRAVWDGHRFAEELDGPEPDDAVPYRREVTRPSARGSHCGSSVNSTATTEPAGRARTIQSVDRAAALLKAVADSARPPTVIELAERTGLNRSTAWRLLATLDSHGLVERDPVASATASATRSSGSRRRQSTTRSCAAPGRCSSSSRSRRARR